MREDKKRGVYVAGATEEYVTTSDEVGASETEWECVGCRAIFQAAFYLSSRLVELCVYLCHCPDAAWSVVLTSTWSFGRVVTDNFRRFMTVLSEG